MSRPTLVADNGANIESAVQTASRLFVEAQAAGRFVALGVLGDMVALENSLLEAAELKTIPEGVREHFRGAARSLRASHDGAAQINGRG